MKEKKIVFISVKPIVCGLAICIAVSGVIAATPVTTGTVPGAGISVSAAPNSGILSSGSDSVSSIAGISVSASVESTGTGTGSGSVFNDPGVIARTGDKDVRIEDMQKTLESLDPAEKAAIAANPDVLKLAIRAILVEQVILKKITAEHWDLQPDIVARLERIRESTLARMYLKAKSEPVDGYPDPQELQSAYEARKASLSVPHRFRLSQIFISLPADADQASTDKARKKLQVVIDQLNQPGANFTRIATQQSDDSLSSSQGGDMGWVNDKQMPAAVRDQARTLAKNALSQPLRIEDGWHILKLVDATDISPIALDEVKVKLTAQLRAERASQTLNEYVKKLLQETPVVINDGALPKILGKTAN